MNFPIISLKVLKLTLTLAQTQVIWSSEYHSENSLWFQTNWNLEKSQGFLKKAKTWSFWKKIAKISCFWNQVAGISKTWLIFCCLWSNRKNKLGTEFEIRLDLYFSWYHVEARITLNENMDFSTIFSQNFEIW